MMRRPRRLRASEEIRNLVAQSSLSPKDFIWPVFLTDGTQKKEAIPALPGIYRWSIDLLIPALKEAMGLGVKAFAIFPKVEESLKDPTGSVALKEDFFLYTSIKKIREALPQALIISDVALDPYSSDGHDGIVKNGKILNDESLEILCSQALLQAKAGAQIVAPSDMMDGRVGAIRKTLDAEGFSETGILSYTAKYASAFYGPFRTALDSAPKMGDKKSYQMDPANQREALLELELDIQEGADIVMVKPALCYLDIIKLFKENSSVPVAAYHVSGEYAMVKLAAAHGLLNEKAAMLESLTAIKRAGADVILSYYAVDFSRDFALEFANQ